MTRAVGKLSPSASSSSAVSLTSSDTFAAVVETAAMNEIEVSEYCRSCGVSPRRTQGVARRVRELADWDDESQRELAKARRPQAYAETGIPERTCWRWIPEGKAATEVADCQPTAEQLTHSTSVAVPERMLRTGLIAAGKRIMADHRSFAVRPTPPTPLSDEELETSGAPRRVAPGKQREQPKRK